VVDRPGVLAEITAALRDETVSIESLIQRGVADNGGVYVVMVTHEAPERAVRAALARMSASDSLVGAPMMMHILDF
jgi:homoserine dehydrogenase